MNNIIEELQKEVYRLDRQIGECAMDLLNSTRDEIDHVKDKKFYEEANAKRTILLAGIEQLKTIV